MNPISYIRERHLVLAESPEPSMYELCSVRWDFRNWRKAVAASGPEVALRTTIQNKKRARECAFSWRQARRKTPKIYSRDIHADCVAAAWGERKIERAIGTIIKTRQGIEA